MSKKRTLLIKDERTGKTTEVDLHDATRIEFWLTNVDGQEKCIRLFIGSNTCWLGVDGYGNPTDANDNATQVTLDVWHMDADESHYENFTKESMPAWKGEAFVQVFSDLEDDDPPIISLGNTRVDLHEKQQEQV